MFFRAYFYVAFLAFLRVLVSAGDFRGSCNTWGAWQTEYWMGAYCIDDSGDSEFTVLALDQCLTNYNGALEWGSE
jgi:CVNH domain